MKYSTKPGKHSFKDLLSVTLDKEVSMNCTSATDSLPITFYRALGTDFAECQSILGKKKSLSRRQVTATETVTSATVTLVKGSLFAEFLLY
jgi:hypothetical protein